MLPEIRIKFGSFLEPIFEAHYRAEPGQGEWKPPSEDETRDKISKFQDAWAPVGMKILSGLTDTLGLNFYQNTVDVYIVSGLRGGFSNPMVISSSPEPDRFIDILTHELTHRLITDNTRGIDYGRISKEMFPDVAEKLVLNHIYVHAVHKRIYLEILNEPYRYERDLARCERFPAYKEAWRIVNELGYENVIADFRNRY